MSKKKVKRVYTRAQKDRRNELKRIREANRSEEQIAIDKEKRAKRYEEDREERLIKQKAYNEGRKEEIAIQKQVKYEAQKLDHTIVYCLPNYNKFGYEKYCGITNNPPNRMNVHKHSQDNNIEGMYVLEVIVCREEAKKREAHYHGLGYAGKKGFEKEWLDKQKLAS